MQLTEEEDDYVSALLSLSVSMHSDNSHEDLDNSELLPIGKKMVDATPVPIWLGIDDVNREVQKLTMKNATKVMDPVTVQDQSSDVTTTIIANRDGSVVTATSEQTQAGKSPTLSSPSKDKTTSATDTPGSPRGNFQLKSYKLKKKGTKNRNRPANPVML